MRTIGRLRDKDLGNRPIHDRATLKDGVEVEGLDGLRKYLLTTGRNAFVRQFCRKLLGYSLGRAVQLSDEPLLAAIEVRLEQSGYHVGTVALVQIQDKPDSVGPALPIENEFCLSSQGSLPDFRHRCRPAAQLSEFELYFLDLLGQLDATNHGCCGLEAFQCRHRAKPLLYPSMILFNGVVQVLAGPYSHSLRQLAGRFQICDCAV